MVSPDSVMGLPDSGGSLPDPGRGPLASGGGPPGPGMDPPDSGAGPSDSGTDSGMGETQPPLQGSGGGPSPPGDSDPDMIDMYVWRRNASPRIYTLLNVQYWLQVDNAGYEHPAVDVT